jgi:hypothetical protein
MVQEGKTLQAGMSRGLRRIFARSDGDLETVFKREEKSKFKPRIISGGS